MLRKLIKVVPRRTMIHTEPLTEPIKLETRSQVLLIQLDRLRAHNFDFKPDFSLKVYLTKAFFQKFVHLVGFYDSCKGPVGLKQLTSSWLSNCM